MQDKRDQEINNLHMNFIAYWSLFMPPPPEHTPTTTTQSFDVLNHSEGLEKNPLLGEETITAQAVK